MSIDLTLIRFIGVGIISVAADFIALAALVGMGLPPLLANLLSFPVGIMTNYSLHRVWTFRSSAPITRELARFLTVSLTGVLISQIVVAAALAIGGAYLVGKCVSIGVVFFWNYALNRRWVF